MARRKVVLQRIANDAKRRAAFRKRRKGLMKKASELSTLCGVDACVVVYGEGEAAQAPEVWPSPAGAAAVLERFKAVPELYQYKKMTNLEGFLGQTVGKLREQVEKARRDCQESETAQLLHDVMAGRRGVGGLTIEEATSLRWMLDARMKSASDRLVQLGGQPLPTAAQAVLALPLPTAAAAVVPPHHAMASFTGAAEAPNQQEGWFMDAAGDIGSVVYGEFGGGSGSFGRSNVSADSNTGRASPFPPM